MGSVTSALTGSASPLRIKPRICLGSHLPTGLAPQSNKRLTYPPASPLRSILGGTGILTCCPSPTPFGLGLGPTNPTRINLPSETLDLRGHGSHMHFATHASILTSARSTSPHGLASTSQNAPLPLNPEEVESIASVTSLSPVIFSAQNH